MGQNNPNLDPVDIILSDSTNHPSQNSLLSNALNVNDSVYQNAPNDDNSNSELICPESEFDISPNISHFLNTSTPEGSIIAEYSEFDKTPEINEIPSEIFMPS